MVNVSTTLVAASAFLCLFAAVFALSSPLISGDDRTAKRLFRCGFIALAALLCAAYPAGGWVGGLAVILTLALIVAAVRAPVSILMIVGILASLCVCLVVVSMAFAPKSGDPIQNTGVVLSAIATFEAVVAFCSGFWAGWT
jgi:hypothetical protein